MLESRVREVLDLAHRMATAASELVREAESARKEVAQLDALSHTVESLKSDISALSSEVGSLKEKRDSLNAALAELRKKLSE